MQADRRFEPLRSVPLKTAIVTGAGTGIGRSVALALLGEGYRVALAGRRAEVLERAVKHAGPNGSRALVVPTDVTRPEAVRALFMKIREAFRLMKSQSPQGGRIINNGSISAHSPRPNSAPYTATKHAITGLTKATALDGRKYDIACSQIDIGNAGTEITDAMKRGVPQAHGGTEAEPLMDVEHVARAFLYMVSLPLSANVLNMTIMATKMPFVGRG